MEAVQSELEKELRAETERADQERYCDRQNSVYKSYNLLLPDSISVDPLPKNTTTAEKPGYAIVTSQSAYEYHEDRADLLLGSERFSGEFLNSTFEAKVDFLRNIVLYLEERSKHFKSGSTLTLSLAWTTVDSSTNKSTSHVLTAQLGDSRAILIEGDNETRKTTRLTSEHQLCRANEREKLVQRGFRVDPLYDGMYYVYKNDKRVGFYDGTYFGGISHCGALMMSRSLGDSQYKESGIFTAKPDISYHTAETTDHLVLASYSDGIATHVSDETVDKTVSTSLQNLGEAAQKIVCWAEDCGNTDNKSIVLTRLNSIQPGQVAIQSNEDGHGARNYNDNVVDQIAADIQKISTASPSAVKLHANALRIVNKFYALACSLNIDTASAQTIAEELAQIGEVDVSQKLKEYIVTLFSDKKCIFATPLLDDVLGNDDTIFNKISIVAQTHALVDAVLSVNKHEKNPGQKYELLRDFGNIIKTHEFESEEQLCNAVKNFFYLALQRDKCGLTNTTDAGEEIRRLLNKREYAELKAFLLPELAENPVKYRDLRKLVSGKENTTRAERKQNEQIFSSSNKIPVYNFWMSKKQTLVQSLIGNSLFSDIQAAIKKQNENKAGCFSCFRKPKLGG